MASENDAPPYFCTNRRKGYCFPACIAMILGYYGMPINPNDEEDLIKLDALTGYDPAQSQKVGVFPYRAMWELFQQGFDAKIIDPFDNERFASEGYEYFKNTYSKFPGRSPAKDFVEGFAEDVCSLLAADPRAFEKKVPTLGDLLSLLRASYLVTCSVGCQELCAFIQQARGYGLPPVSAALRSHSVLVYKSEDESLVFHDPFYPRNRAVRVPAKLFDEKIWVAPSKDLRFVTAFRLSEKAA